MKQKNKKIFFKSLHSVVLLCCWICWIIFIKSCFETKTEDKTKLNIFSLFFKDFNITPKDFQKFLSWWFLCFKVERKKGKAKKGEFSLKSYQKYILNKAQTRRTENLFFL